jgi:hypothetical protein
VSCMYVSLSFITVFFFYANRESNEMKSIQVIVMLIIVNSITKSVSCANNYSSINIVGRPRCDVRLRRCGLLTYVNI